MIQVRFFFFRFRSLLFICGCLICCQLYYALLTA
jgi:hypothetical protein